jgi:YebC/PmpR family DNA-binding regulatory protein
MPKDNIERAIQRALGKDATHFTEVIYEGFGPGGVAIMVEAATDNTMRITPEVKSIFNKVGASFGQKGSVAYQFKQVGRIIVTKNNKSLDEIFAIAADGGAEDIEELDDEFIIYTKAEDLARVRQSLSSVGLNISEASLVREPVVGIEIADQDLLLKIEHFVNALEELDDVQKVYTNLL